MATPRSRHCLVTALRLRGFTPLVERSVPGKVQQLVSTVRGLLRGDDQLATMMEVTFSLTGDRVLRVIPLDSAYNQPHSAGLVFQELLRLVHAQVALLRYGVRLQGGITLGVVYTGRDHAVGSGVSAASRLVEIARVPRVIIDPSLLLEVETNRALRKDTHSAKEEISYIKQLIRDSADGFRHVDYLRAIASELDHPAQYPSFLLDHRRELQEALAKSTMLDEQRADLLWLSTYHNRVVQHPPSGFSFDAAKKRELTVDVAVDDIVDETEE